MTVNVWPAIVAWPVRAPPVFESTDMLSVDSPEPLPLCTWIHPAWDVAVQAQPSGELTRTVTEPPSTPMLVLVLLSEYTQGAASCTTEKR